MESDEEIRRVPEIGGESAVASVSGRENSSLAGPDRVQAAGESQRKRGRTPADKESKRLKRYAQVAQLHRFMADFTILPFLAISLGSLAFLSNCGFLGCKTI